MQCWLACLAWLQCHREAIPLSSSGAGTDFTVRTMKQGRAARLGGSVAARYQAIGACSAWTFCRERYTQAESRVNSKDMKPRGLLGPALQALPRGTPRAFVERARHPLPLRGGFTLRKLATGTTDICPNFTCEAKGARSEGFSTSSSSSHF